VEQRFDAVVVGCGPAGSAAGYVLASRGLSVALLDRAAFPRPKLCGGLLTWKTVRALETVFGLDADGLAGQGLLLGSTDRYGIFDRDRTLVAGRAPHPFRFVDRQRFDAHLLDLARTAGARVFERRSVTGCDANEGSVTTATGERFVGSYVIGADGATSVVRNALSFDKRVWRRNLAAAVEVALSPADLPITVDHPMLYVGFVNAGYSWLFPAGDTVLAGLCGLKRSNSCFHHLFREFLDFLGVADPDSIPLKGHPLPYGNAIADPSEGRVLLAGDAGGFVEPLFGEGIFYALTTGRYAAEAVLEAVRSNRAPGPSYKARLARYILPEMKGSNRLRFFLLALIKCLGPLPIGPFVKFQPTRLAEMVHGLRSYWLLKKKVWD
jgi:geranylgeranyl reductase family protein